MLRFISRLVAFWALLAVLLVTPVLASAQAEDSPVAALQKVLTDDSKALQDISQSLQNVKGDDASAEQALEALKDSLDKTRADLVALEAKIAAARNASQANINQMGPVPKPSDPPENEDKADTRQKEQALNQQLGDLQTGTRQQIAQADGLVNSFAIMPMQQTLAEDRKALADVGAHLAELNDDDADIQPKLEALRRNVDKSRAALVDLVSEVTQSREATKANLDRLGPKPKAGEPAESKDVASQREAIQARLDQLTTLLGDSQAQIKQADGVNNSITVRPFQARVNADKKTLDDVEASIATISSAGDQAQQFLQEQRSKVDTVRSDLATLLTTLIDQRNKSQAKLGTVPDASNQGSLPESWDVSTARDKEKSLLDVLVLTVGNAQLQANRADDLTNSIIERQRALITGQLFTRQESMFTGAFWKPVIDNVPDTIDRAVRTFSEATAYFSRELNSTSIAIFLMTIAIGYVVVQFLRFRIMRWQARLPTKKKATLRYVASLDAVLELVNTMLGLPAAVFVTLLAFRLSGLLPLNIIWTFGSNFLFAALVGVGLWALARAILAQKHSDLRLLPLSDWAVRRIARRMGWLALVLGVSALLNGIINSLHAHASLTQARAAITAAFFIIIIASLLIRLRNAPPTIVNGQPLPPDEDLNALDVLRPISWVAVVSMAGCLTIGYNVLAVAVAALPLILLSVIAASYLLTTLVDAALTENLVTNADHRRAVASAIGITSRSVAFGATLLSGVLRLLILVLAILTLGLPFGFYSGDMLPVMQRAYFGFQVGGMTISPSSIIAAVVMLIGIWALTRLVTGWMRNTLLPRTAFDAGLQNSIATIVGYAGFILAISVALAETGIGLQNVAYVASALAVGIGFGLQAIVNNFVSGLILLAERPIRVGDIIAAGGEEGYVRRISVRATEIETFERATLIIPNSTLITGSVKNWVYGNTWSLLRIALTLAYDSDIDAVKAAMLGAAEDDPRILPTPPPRVYLSKIDSGLEFQLVVMIASMETQPAVKSDVLTRILKTFRTKGIRLLAQGAAVAAPVVVRFDEELQSAAIAKLAGGKTDAKAADPGPAPAQPQSQS